MKQFVRILSLAMIVCTLVGAMIIPANAATSWPATSGIKTYVISTSNNTTVYQTATSTGKYGTIYASDLITIIGYSGSRLKVTYPISGGTKTGYIEKSAVTSSAINTAQKTFTASSSMTVYRRSSGSATIGSIYKNDKVYVIASSGSRSQVIYPISGGYKMGWIPTSDISTGVTVYMQKDSSWANEFYGYSDAACTKKATIGSAGCGLLSLTNAVYYLNGTFINPKTIATYSLNNGFRINGVGTSMDLYKSFAHSRGKTYGIAFVHETSSWETLKSDLQKGYVAIVSKPGHIMTIVDYNASTGKYLLLDSYPSSARGTSNGYIWATQSYLQNTVGLRSAFYVLKSLN